MMQDLPDVNLYVVFATAEPTGNTLNIGSLNVQVLNMPWLQDVCGCSVILSDGG
jgi:hypothetical protein